MTLFQILLVSQVCAGAVALLAATLATIAKTLSRFHKLHVRSGRAFFWALKGAWHLEAGPAG